MKKIITTIACILFLVAAQAQKISESEARQYLEKVWDYLKTADSKSFVNLWLPEDSAWQKLHTPAEGMKLMESYRRLRDFLGTAISENRSITNVEVGKEDARGTEIIAYIKAREHATVGFSFFVVPVNGKWSARSKPHFLAISK